MVLESPIICVDNSEYMRNGDFLPTRLQAQQDAVNLITQSKLRSNPESNVGLLTLGCLEVLVTLTAGSGKLLAKLHGVTPTGNIQLISGIKIAHLALKHRQGKNHKTRIVVFIGSPILDAPEKDLIKLAKKLKKEKVNVDIISFGEDADNADILKKFMETINGKEGTGSHLVTVPPTPHLSQALVSSPIVQGEDGSGVVPSGGGFEFGVDPNEDPELALALRVSMEEQRARQEAEEGSKEGGSSGEPTNAATPAEGEGGATSEETLLQRALAMSMDTDEPAAESKTAPDLASMTEEEQILYAMRMSMADNDSQSKPEDSSKMEVDESGEASKDDCSGAMKDSTFLQNVLENLPGVDQQSDPSKETTTTTSTSGGKSKDDKEDKKKENTTTPKDKK
uniref:26S proteasome non-ATPase regulatory subunit 4 n=1 Tax=Lepeophtheirus salmonis TaxID=72036 RepID=C1BV97_LEPSM|nr:26S proteasome non-ATPase regulatory subunit 4 [Lepeophtheirus salmonis]